MNDWFTSLRETMPWLVVALWVLLPVLGFVLIAVGGRALWWRMRQRRAAVVDRPAMRSNLGLPLNEVEHLANKFYRAQGYEVLAPGELSQSPGELLAIKNNERTVIRCLAGSEATQPGDVEALAELRARRHASYAVLIAPAGFTSETRRRAVQLGVELRDRNQLFVMETRLDRQLPA